jgi:ATP-dependent Clp protease ATP-binding subunit ClpC
MFERFTEGARRATALASQEARQLNHDFIGTEHLLLGLLAVDEGVALAVLTEHEVTLEDVRRKVNERVHAYGSGPFGRGDVESPPFTPLAKKALERSHREALQLNAPHIATEHLLLGLIAVPDGGGARILVELAGNLDRIRQAVLGQVEPRLQGEGATIEQTKAPVTSGTLRRWAAQGRTVLRPPSVTTEPASPASPAPPDDPMGPAPYCPACRSPLETGARYRQLRVPPGIQAEDGEPAADQPAVEVVAVYCGHCGVTVGLA